MGEKPAQVRKQKLLSEFRLSVTLANEPSMEQIGQLLVTELASDSEAQKMIDKANKRKAKAKTNAGRILIICDTPLPKYLIPWLTAKRYIYTVVNSEEEATAYLSHENYDCVIYSHEFY